MIFTWLFWCMLVVAVVDWIGSWQNWGRVRWVTKPGTLILLIAWFTQIGGWRGELVWFGLGLVFSLLGDVFLQAPPRFFLFGMVAFLLAHLMYITGFAQKPVVLDWKLIFPILLIVALYTWLTSKIRAGLRQRGETEMLYPVMGYATFLSLMFFFALTTLFRAGWLIPSAAIASVGAGFFFLSDSILAYNRFVYPIANSDLIVMVTYHIGQILIAAGALFQFAGLGFPM